MEDQDARRLLELIRQAGERDDVQGIGGIYAKARPILARLAGLPEPLVDIKRVGKAGDLGTRFRQHGVGSEIGAETTRPGNRQS